MMNPYCDLCHLSSNPTWMHVYLLEIKHCSLWKALLRLLNTNLHRKATYTVTVNQFTQIGIERFNCNY